MAERRMKKGLTEFNIPVPESFQASRRQSVATGESLVQKIDLWSLIHFRKNGTPLRLPQLNWRKLKKKVCWRKVGILKIVLIQVSFKYPSSSSTQSPLTTSSPSSLKVITLLSNLFIISSYQTPFDKSAYLKSKSFDAGNSFCVGPEIPYRKWIDFSFYRNLFFLSGPLKLDMIVLVFRSKWLVDQVKIQCWR